MADGEEDQRLRELYPYEFEDYPDYGETQDSITINIGGQDFTIDYVDPENLKTELSNLMMQLMPQLNDWCIDQGLEMPAGIENLLTLAIVWGTGKESLERRGADANKIDTNRDLQQAVWNWVNNYITGATPQYYAELATLTEFLRSDYKSGANLLMTANPEWKGNLYDQLWGRFTGLPNSYKANMTPEQIDTMLTNAMQLAGQYSDEYWARGGNPEAGFLEGMEKALSDTLGGGASLTVKELPQGVMPSGTRYGGGAGGYGGGAGGYGGGGEMYLDWNDYLSLLRKYNIQLGQEGGLPEPGEEGWNAEVNMLRQLRASDTFRRGELVELENRAAAEQKWQWWEEGYKLRHPTTTEAPVEAEAQPEKEWTNLVKKARKGAIKL